MVNIGIFFWVVLILRFVYVWLFFVLSTWYIIGFLLFFEIIFLNSILLNIYYIFNNILFKNVILGNNEKLIIYYVDRTRDG